MQTTDLHMHLLAYDYFTDQANPALGLAPLADAITQERDRDAATTVLFDNGDFLQGNPLADHLAETLAPDAPHPMGAAMNVLGYDAVTLGNHEFDYGLDFLRRTLGNIDCPKVSANISVRDGPALAKPFLILSRMVLGSDGQLRPIKIGVTGFAPPQIADWAQAGQSRDIAVGDILQAARNVAPQMRAAGADLTIALCHSGIGHEVEKPRMENAALPLAAIDGIDVILTGHIHALFPDPAWGATPPANGKAGLLHGKPAVMAGYYGSTLGVIDLGLEWTANGWHVNTAQSRHAYPPTADTPKSPARANIEALTAPYHQATLAKIRTPIAETRVPIHSYFAPIMPDLAQQILASAMQDKVRNAMPDQRDILAAVAPFRFGGHAGLGHYIDIPKGPIALRDTAAIFPFADHLCAVKRTGLQLRNWLERSAAYFNHLESGETVQQLINPHAAGYNCDAIYGLTYCLDLTQPARFDHTGQLMDPTATRICDLQHNGRPIADDDTFTVATNAFRMNGGSGFEPICATDILWQGPDKLRDVLATWLKAAPPFAAPLQQVWDFVPIAHTAAQFQSAAGARTFAHGKISYSNTAANGLETYSITF